MMFVDVSKEEAIAMTEKIRGEIVFLKKMQTKTFSYKQEKE